jgi:phage baseplate assembly protein W
LRSHEVDAFEVKKVNYNIKTPIKLSHKQGELFVMNTTLADMIADNLRNLLLTNRGERVMNPQFGANLKAILAEFGQPGFENEVMARINTAVKKFLPYVALSTLSVDSIPSPPSSGLTIIRFSIKYGIPAAQVTDEEISVTLSTIA